MAVITLVNNVQSMSSSATHADIALHRMNQGSVAILATPLSHADMSSSFNTSTFFPMGSLDFVAGASFSDMSSSFILESYFASGTLDFLAGASFSDMSSSYDGAMYGIPSGSFLLSMPFPVSGSVVTAAAAVFIMRGFYLVTGQYQYWQGSSRDTPPPSGNPLIEITVIGVIPGGTS